MSEIVGRLEAQIKRHYTRAVVQSVDETGNGSLWVRAVGGASTVMSVITGTATASSVVELPGNNTGGLLSAVSGTVTVCNEPTVATVYTKAPASPAYFPIAAGLFRVVLAGGGSYQLAYPRDAFYTKLTILAAPAQGTSFRFVHPTAGTYTFVFDPGNIVSDDAPNKTYHIYTATWTLAGVATALSSKINSVFTTNKEMWSNTGAGAIAASVIILSFDLRWTEGLELHNIYNVVTDLNTTIPAFRSKNMTTPSVSEGKDLVLAQYAW
jgi:hypothetical protein